MSIISTAVNLQVVLILRKNTSVITAVLLAVLMIFCAVPAFAADAPQNSAQSAVLMDADGGEVLYEKHADKTMLIASTTKIMTGLVVLENCDVSEEVIIRPEWTGIEGSSIYLKSGETLTVEELLYGMLLNSGNDAAVALACHTAGSIEAFADMMNERAELLGLVGTSFRNPHGLDENGHMSTARDLAVITAAALENELFSKIVSTKSITIGGRSLTNHNKLLWNYEGAVGVKTGYTKSAGRILVSAAERDGLKLICVTISDPDDWTDHAALFDWGFQNWRRQNAVPDELSEFYLPVISGDRPEVKVVAEGDYSVLMSADDRLEIKTELPRFVYADVKKGDTAGRITVIKNGEQLGTVDLVYTESVLRDETQLLSFGRRLLRMLFK